MEDIQPLPKELYDEAVRIGVTTITLEFSGGDDEGYAGLDIEYAGEVDETEKSEFYDKVSDWQDAAYDYPGCGDGIPYGDNITYDLVNRKATISEWGYELKQGDTEEEDLTFADAEEEEEWVHELKNGDTAEEEE